MGDNPKIRLSKAQFHRIKKAKKCLLEVVNIEEKFNLIIENFREFEMELLGRSINEMLTPDFEWSSAISESSLINRRIANLMSACRLYLDHIIHHFNIMYIFTDITQHRQRMERKHRVPSDLTRIFVTGQVDGDIQTTRFPGSGKTPPKTAT